jgi:hypothetical protein
MRPPCHIVGGEQRCETPWLGLVVFPSFPGFDRLSGPLCVRSISVGGDVVVDVIGMLWAATTVDVTVADVDTVTGVLSDVAGVRRWLDGAEIACTTRLAELAAVSPSLFPEQIHATATRTSLRAGTRAADRATTVAAVPALRSVLAAGARRRILAEHGQVMAEWARTLDPDDFRTRSRGWPARSKPTTDSTDSPAKNGRSGCAPGPTRPPG